jgi:hypothetical protein
LTTEESDASLTPAEETWLNKQLVKFTSTYREVRHFFNFSKLLGVLFPFEFLNS